MQEKHQIYFLVVKKLAALARLLVDHPEMVFADESTAAADKESGCKLDSWLRKLADLRRTVVYMVTHYHRVLNGARWAINMQAGLVLEDYSNSA